MKDNKDKTHRTANDNEKNKNINTSKENSFGDSSMIAAFMHALLCCENSHEYDSTFPILCLITNGTHTRNEYELIEYIKQCSKFEENNIHFDNGNFNNRMIDDSISTIGKIAIKNRNSNSSVNTNISVLLKDRASNNGNNLSEIKDETEIETLAPTLTANLKQLTLDVVFTANNLDDIEIELIHLMKRVASPVLEDIAIDIGVSHCRENPFNLNKQMIRYIRDYVTIEFGAYPSRVCDLYHSFDNGVCIYYKYNVHHKVISKLKQNHISDKKYDSLNESLMIKMCHIYKPVSNVYVKGYTCDDRAIKLQIGCCNYNNVIKPNARSKSKPIRVNLNVASAAMIEKRINILTAPGCLWEIVKKVEMYQARHGFENDTSNVRIYKTVK